MTPPPTDRLAQALADRYRIERELGQGGMATVYLAHDVRHDRKVAIKVLKPELAAVLGAERFVQEIKTTAALAHPHILPLFDSGEADGFLYYVMPYIQGETIREKLNRETQFGIDEAVKITTEVADALDYAHRHGVIHRDIKPENILLHDGRAMVMDFGIALAVSAAAGGRMTETGLSLGTPHYMSPEQATADKSLTGRSDVYSLASVLYEMLTGDPPHTGSSAQQIIMKIVTEEPAPVTMLRKSVPPNVAAAVAKALEKLPADRFATANDFADALVNPGFTTQTAGVAALGGSRSWLSDWRSRLALGVASLSLAAIVALLVLRPGNRGALTGMSVAQITFGDETIFTARWAPDGKTIVYSAARVGVIPRVYVVRPDYPEPQPVGPDSIQLLSVSSQGELALLTNPQFAGRQLFLGTLARMPLGGGAPREVMENVHQADWSPDGSQLAVTHAVGDRVQLEYPVGKVLYQSHPGGYVSGLRISPAGDRIVFFDHPKQLDDRGVVMVVDTAGNATAISQEFRGLEGLAWEPGGKSVLFAGTQGGMYQIHRAAVGQAVQLVLPSPGTLTLGDVSKDGRWLVSRDDAPFRMMAHVPGAPGLRDLSWLDGSWGPHLSGDGSVVAFSDQSLSAGQAYSIVLRKTDGSPVVRLGEGSVAALSPDKGWVLGYLTTAPLQWVLYPTGPGDSRALKWTGLDAVTSVDFFPDSRSLFVCGSGPGRPARCYRSALDASSLEPVTPDSVGSGLLRPDGRAIAYQAAEGWRIYPLDGSPSRLVPDSKGAEVIRWNPNGTELWATTTLGLKIGAERLDVASGRRTPLSIELPSDFRIFAAFNLSLADDPHYYAYNTWSYSSKLFAIQGVR